MAVTSVKKAEIISKFQVNKKDTGSAQVQVAILTEDILNLTEHLKIHRKDIATRRSLLKKVATRRRFLNYIKDKDINIYRTIIGQLNLRK